VKAVNEVSMPRLFGDRHSDSVTIPHGTLALCNALAVPDAVAGLSGAEVTFDNARKKFTVDFTWTSDKNAELLRISDVPIQFK
jgi:hypothetical protein